jgi:hypothetical protein
VRCSIDVGSWLKCETQIILTYSSVDEIELGLASGAVRNLKTQKITGI